MSTPTAPARIARAISVLGHPLLLLPAAVLWLVASRERDPALAIRLAVAIGLAGLLVMGFSAWQVRRGQWGHVDASAAHERRALNGFLLMVTGVAGGLAWLAALPELALGLWLSAALIAVALLASRWAKLSLHVGFAVFAAALLLPASLSLGVAAGAFAGLVGWSRLQLDRHAPRDLVLGAVVGALAGVAFWRVAASWAG